ncbi:MAG: hypothetical protein AAF500_00320 [Myxococcota bacterium]
MSDPTTILTILATFALMIVSMTYLFVQAHVRKDQIVTGIINGRPVSTKHRWIMLFFDFLGYANACVILLGVFAYGYFRAASAFGDSLAGDLALLCGVTAAFGVGAVFFPVIILVSYMVSAIRSSDSAGSA